MRTLLVLRHAKSSWKAGSLPDHERPLNGRGRRDAPRVGRYLARCGLVPDRVVSSTAVRAQTTARLVAEHAGMADPLGVDLLAELYLAGPEAYLAALATLPPHVDTALVVGHNPDVEELVLALTGRAVDLPTAAFARIRLASDDWASLAGDEPPTAELEEVLTPKDLPEAASS